MKEGLIAIANWLNSGRNYADGVVLFNTYGRNEQLKKLFPGREHRYKDKLAYELGKLIGLGGASIKAPAAGNVAEKSGADLRKETTKQLPAAVAGAIYPPVIDRIRAEMSRLFNERALIKKQVNAVSDENTQENIAKRFVLNQLIEAISLRLDQLHHAKSDFLLTGTQPDEKALFPDNLSATVVEEPKQETPEELRKQLKNLRTYQTKDSNMLEYQNTKKQRKPNPMPECPKRKEIEERMAGREKEIKEIEKKLSDVDREGADPEGQDTAK